MYFEFSFLVSYLWIRLVKHLIIPKTQTTHFSGFKMFLIETFFWQIDVEFPTLSIKSSLGQSSKSDSWMLLNIVRASLDQNTKNT